MQHRLAMGLVWFFGFGSLGLYLPFVGLYLHENAGLDAARVGVVLAVLPLVGLFVQPFWGQLADRTGGRAQVLVGVSLGSAAGYASLAVAEGFAGLVLATAFLAVFLGTFTPAAVAVTLALGRSGDPHAFGLSRVWGTVGFLCLVAGFPWILEAVQRARGLEPVPGGPSQPGLELAFALSSALAFAAAIVALRLPRRGAVAARAARGDWRRLARNAPFLRVLAFSLAAYVCLQGPLTIFPLFVRERGGSLDAVSGMWVPMLLLEIPLVALSGASLERFGARGLIAIGVFCGGLRWLACGLASDLSWLYPVQVLHAVTVAGFILGAPLYVEAAMPEQLRSTAQGVLTMVGSGLGGVASNLAAGWLFEHLGADAPYLIGGAGALALGLLVPVLLPPPRPPAPDAGGS